MSQRMGDRLVVVLALVVLMAPPISGQAPPQYEVYAIEYGYIGTRPAPQYLPGADSGLVLDGSYMIWLLKGTQGRNVIVDAGFRPDIPRQISLTSIN